MLASRERKVEEGRDFLFFFGEDEDDPGGDPVGKVGVQSRGN